MGSTCEMSAVFFFWGCMDSKRLHRSSGKEKESRCLVFTSSTKREIWQFHVVVVQWRQRNVQKSVMHVQSRCFADLNRLLFCCSRLTLPLSVLIRDLTIRQRRRLWKRHWEIDSASFQTISRFSQIVLLLKGDVTRDDSQRRLLAQHSVAMLEQCCNQSKQCRNNVTTLFCAKLRIISCNITWKEGNLDWNWREGAAPEFSLRW